MNKQEEYWSHEDGNAYHARNRVDWVKRIRFWSQIWELINFRSAFEIGCGPGWNLSAIRHIQAESAALPPPVVMTYGCDINEHALRQAVAAGHTCFRGMAEEMKGTVDLAFTVGVLIHQEDPREMMQDVIDLSADYVLAVEYGDTEERHIPYQGQENLCWARPYGAMYEDMGLKMVSTGGAGSGFDDCTFWLLRK